AGQVLPESWPHPGSPRCLPRIEGEVPAELHVRAHLAAISGPGESSGREDAGSASEGESQACAQAGSSSEGSVEARTRTAGQARGAAPGGGEGGASGLGTGLAFTFGGTSDRKSTRLN